MMSLASPDAGPRGIEPPLAGPKALRLKATLLLMSVFGGTVISACNEAISTTETQSSVSAPADEGDISSSEPSPTATATEAPAVVPTPEIINEWSEAGQGVLAVDGWDGTQGRLRVGAQENLGTVVQENENFTVTVETADGVEVTGELSNMWTEHENPYNRSHTEPLTSFVGRNQEGNVVLLENVDGQWQELTISGEIFASSDQITDRINTIEQFLIRDQQRFKDGFYTDEQMEGKRINAELPIFSVSRHERDNGIRWDIIDDNAHVDGFLPAVGITGVVKMPIETDTYSGDAIVLGLAILDESGMPKGFLYLFAGIPPDEFTNDVYSYRNVDAVLEGLQNTWQANEEQTSLILQIFIKSESQWVTSPIDRQIQAINDANLPTGASIDSYLMELYENGIIDPELQRRLIPSNQMTGL